MILDVEQLMGLARVGLILELALYALLVVLVPVAVWWWRTRDRRAWAGLRILLIAAAVWLLSTFVFAVAALAILGRPGTAVVVLLLPLCVVYGIRKARRRMAVSRANGRGLAGTLVRLGALPLFVLVCLNVALADQAIEQGRRFDLLFGLFGAAPQTAMPQTIWTDSGTMNAVIGALRLFGYGALYLFFLTVPYIGGSLVAAILIVLDRMGVDWDALVPDGRTASLTPEPEDGGR